MRLTSEKLRRYAQQFVAQRSQDLRLLAAYLSGSLLRDRPFLGGAADVDLVLIYNGAPEPEREIVPLPGNAHLDVYHHDRRRYEPPRRLRVAPFWGPTLFLAEPLYDPQHFLDFVQAAVRSRFRAPEMAAARARGLLQAAREAWFGLEDAPTPQAVAAYLEVVFQAANVPATLLGYTFSRRRVLLDFPLAAQRWGYEGLTGLLFRQVGAPQTTAEALREALPSWEAAWLAAAEAAPTDPELAPARRPYYRQAIEAYLASTTPAHALYPLLYTWTQAVCKAPAEHQPPWEAFLKGLGLTSERQSRLDAFLDALEEALEDWSRRQGVV